MNGLPDLKRRLIISICFSAIATVLIAFSFLPFVSFLAATVIALLAGVGVWEYAQLVRAKELEPAVKLMVLVAVLQVFACFFSFLCPYHFLEV